MMSGRLAREHRLPFCMHARTIHNVRRQRSIHRNWTLIKTVTSVWLRDMNCWIIFTHVAYTVFYAGWRVHWRLNRVLCRRRLLLSQCQRRASRRCCQRFIRGGNYSCADAANMIFENGSLLGLEECAVQRYTRICIWPKCVGIFVIRKPRRDKKKAECTQQPLSRFYKYKTT